MLAAETGDPAGGESVGEIQEWLVGSDGLVFATWALAQPDARLEDISRLLGHSSIRTNQDRYITPDGDLHHRFYEATA
jgi:integrase